MFVVLKLWTLERVFTIFWGRTLSSWKKFQTQRHGRAKHNTRANPSMDSRHTVVDSLCLFGPMLQLAEPDCPLSRHVCRKVGKDGVLELVVKNIWVIIHTRAACHWIKLQLSPKFQDQRRRFEDKVLLLKNRVIIRFALSCYAVILVYTRTW